MIYLTGHSGPAVRAVAWQEGLGLLAQPTSGYAGQVGEWPVWAADNGCYAQGARFRLDRYLRWLERLTAARDTCLFAVAPDVLGDAVATMARSHLALAALRRLGFPAAYVAQDGSEAVVPPWDAFDCLFVGGTTAWKLGPHVPPLVAEAKRRGKWVHMGRVNSARRFRLAAAIGCDSADGTFLAVAPNANLRRLLRWVRQTTLPYSAMGKQ